MNKTHEITTLGGGCFWCLEAVFSELRGVENMVSGYSGGSTALPFLFVQEQTCTEGFSPRWTSAVMFFLSFLFILSFLHFEARRFSPSLKALGDLYPFV